MKTDDLGLAAVLDVFSDAVAEVEQALSSITPTAKKTAKMAQSSEQDNRARMEQIETELAGTQRKAKR